jgi:hypothetical protein
MLYNIKYHFVFPISDTYAYDVFAFDCKFHKGDSNLISTIDIQEKTNKYIFTTFCIYLSSYISMLRTKTYAFFFFYFLFYLLFVCGYIILTNICNV